MRMPKRTTDAPDDPDKLVRREAGTYRTADERFEVRQGDLGWFVVDTAQTNEFGQELMHGPFSTLKAAREAIPGARNEKVTPIRRQVRSATRRAKPAPAPEPRPSWIDRLPPGEAAELRRLIRAVEAEGITDAEALVRRDHEGLLPAVATQLIERRLEAVVDEVAPEERGAARDLVRDLVGRVAAVLAGEGRPSGALPGWSLVELGPEPEPPNRRIHLER
jgi:hypothetical protein